MRIGELARRTGVSERALRYYEEQGLLRPTRRPSGYREYAETDVTTVRRIRTLLAAGLGTTVIAGMLTTMVEDGDRLVPICDEPLEVLRRERARLAAAMDDLRAAAVALDAMIEAQAPPELVEEVCSGYDDEPARQPALR